ncbi:MAG: FAD-dependent oxidoreductase [Erysipelotrichaceae bacterium]
MDIQYDVIIIGAGPAGMTAAVYATRAGLKTAMLEKSAPGGKMVKTFEVENWPGIKHTNGADLAYQMFEHSTYFGAEYLYGDVQQVIHHEGYQEIISDQQIYYAKVVIVASGTVEKLLGIPGELEYAGKGVSYCAVCDGAFYKDKVVTVLGGGNSALEETIYLSQFVKEINLVIRRDVFRADPIIQEKLLANKKVNIIKKHIPISIQGNGQYVQSISLQDVETNQEMVLETSGVFPYIGAVPATSFLDAALLNEQGYMIVDKNMQTSCPGIYGAGDVVVKSLRQIVTAVNDGAIAAQHAFHYIKG